MVHPYRLLQLAVLLLAASTVGSAQAQTTVNLPPVADATLCAAFGNPTSSLTNYGGAGTETFQKHLQFGYDRTTASGGSATWGYSYPLGFCTMLVRFDLSTIPSHARVTAAGIHLSMKGTVWSGPSHAFPIRLKRVTTPWGEYSVTGQARPATGLFETEDTYPTTGFRRTYFNMVPLVQAWVDGAAPNYGVEIERSEALLTDVQVYFESRENASSAYRPYLSVTYESPDPSTPPEIRIDPLTLTFNRLAWSSLSSASGLTAGASVSTRPPRAAAIRVQDAQADLGPIRLDHIVVRFRPATAAMLHALAISTAGSAGGTVEAAVLPGLEGLVELLKPPVPAVARLASAVASDPELAIGLAPSAAPPSADSITRLESLIASDATSRGPLGIFYARLTPGVSPAEASAALEARPDVEYAHPSPLLERAAVPNDPLYPRMWNLPRIGLPAAWDVSGNSVGNVRVAVVDTGVRITHSELTGRTVAPVDVYPDDGDAYADSDPDNDDPDGHGTSCAGIVASARNNGSLVAGIAPVKIIPVNGHASGLIANYWDGIYWGVDHGATVVSLSLGSHRSGAFEVELDAIAYAEAHDVLVVAAAGNGDGDADTHYPSAIPYTLSVGAIDDDGVRVRRPRWWWGSNHGSTVDITAPGQGDQGPDSDSILTLGSSSNTAFVNSFNGTSAATPHVAAVLALLKHINPALTGRQLRAIAEGTATDRIGDPAEDTAGWDEFHGHGLVNASAAATMAAAADSQFFTIWNDGDQELSVSSIALDAAAPWVSWTPSAPFNVYGHSQKLVRVTVNRATSPPEAVTRRLLVSSNDSDESPYPGGVFVSLTCSPTFSKLEPGSGSSTVRPTTLSWEPSCGATSYDVCVDTIDNGSCDTTFGDAGGVTHVTMTELAARTRYYWQVRARNAAGRIYANGAASAYWNFTTTAGPPGAFSKLAPATGALDVSTSPTLSWARSSGATDYQVCIDTLDNGACDTTYEDVGDATSLVAPSLETGTRYYWQVRASNSEGTTFANGSANAFWTFTTNVGAPTLTGLRLSKTLIAGCLSTTGKLTLAAPAPAPGVVVSLSSSNPKVRVPLSVTVKAGSAIKSFLINTDAVATREAAVITATLGSSLSAALTLRPIGSKALTLTPGTTVGGSRVDGTVTLECPAAPNSIVVSLSSTKPGVASPEVSSVIVPAGTSAKGFGITTFPVSVLTKPTIKARANETTRSKALLVTPGP